MQKITSILNYFKNKYIIATIIFLVLIIFFDRNNLFEQFDRIKDLNKLKDQKEYYTKEIDSTNLKIKELRANPKLLEKHAREQLFMHKDSEDVFILNKTVKSSDE